MIMFVSVVLDRPLPLSNSLKQNITPHTDTRALTRTHTHLNTHTHIWAWTHTHEQTHTHILTISSEVLDCSSKEDLKIASIDAFEMPAVAFDAEDEHATSLYWLPWELDKLSFCVNFIIIITFSFSLDNNLKSTWSLATCIRSKLV